MLCAVARGCARPLRQGRSLLLCAQVCGRRPDARPARGQEAAFRQSRATCGGWRHCFLCHRAGPPLCPRGNKRGALATAALSVFFVSEQDHRYVQEVRERGPRYGGTVFFVTKQDHRYVQEVRERGALAMAALSSLSPCRTTSMSKR